MQAVLRFAFIVLIVAATLVGATPARQRRLLPTRVRGEVDAPLPRTNAERLARGLPPAAPRGLFSSSRVRRQGVTSATPTMYGNIAVYQAGTNVLRGYISGATPTPSIVSSAPATPFSYATPASVGMPVDIHTPTSRHVAVGSNSGVPSLLSATSANSARFLTAMNLTPPGSTPQRDTTTSAQYDETTFSIDPSTNIVTVDWVNYDGSLPSTVVMQQGAYLYLTGSAQRFTAIASGSLQVTLVWESVSA